MILSEVSKRGSICCVYLVYTEDKKNPHFYVGEQRVSSKTSEQISK